MKKDTQTMKLSISLMVSNTIDTIEKCMKSIEPILKQVPSELIVVDTGGTDGSIEIARKYADKVVPFTWCDDFAKARNAGLQEATGEWFMFLDDDEWFEDAAEIISFFNSGEYKQYKIASYLIRNYQDWAGEKYTEMRSARMVKKTKQTKFINPIHEYLYPLEEPEKCLNCFVHHYGYVLDNQEERRKHAERNITLLKKEIERNPRNYSMWMQLAQEYNFIDELEKSKETALHIIENISQYQDIDIRIAGWLLNDVIAAEMRMHRLESAYDYAKEYLAYPWPNTLTKGNIAIKLQEICYILGRYEESHEAYLCYDEICGILLKDFKRQRREEMLLQTVMLKEEPRAQALVLALIAAYSMSREDQCGEYIRRLRKLAPVKIQQPKLWDLLKQIIAAEWNADAAKLQKYLLAEEEHLNIIVQFLEREGADAKERKQLLEWLDRYECDSLNNIEQINYLQFQGKLYNTLFLRMKEKEFPFETLQQYALKYVSVSETFYKLLYREDVFEDERQVFLPRDCQFALCLKGVLQEDKAELDRVKELRKAVDIYPAMAGFCKEYLRQMQEAGRKPEVSGEFLQLGIQIKGKVRELMEQGNYEAAGQTLEQLAALLPGDAEVQQLKEEVWKKKNT